MRKSGIFYFIGHVPNNFQRHYEARRIVICLKTRNRDSALEAILSMVTKLDDFLRRRSKIEQVINRNEIIQAPGLREACSILFAEQADEKLNEYIQAQ